VTALLAAQGAGKEDEEAAAAAAAAAAAGEDPLMADFGAGMPTSGSPRAHEAGGGAAADGEPHAAAAPSTKAELAAAAAAAGAPATRIGAGSTAASAIDWASIRSEALARQSAAEAAEAAAAAAKGSGAADGEAAAATAAEAGEPGSPYDPGAAYDLDEYRGLESEEPPQIEDDVEDLAPIVGARGKDGGDARPPGAAVWAGRFATAGAGAYSAVVTYLGGAGPLDQMLGLQVSALAFGGGGGARRCW